MGSKASWEMNNNSIHPGDAREDVGWSDGSWQSFGQSTQRSQSWQSLLKAIDLAELFLDIVRCIDLTQSCLGIVPSMAAMELSF